MTRTSPGRFTPGSVKAGIGWLVAAAFLAYGMIRLVVGGLLIAQAVGALDFAEFRTILGEVETFIGARTERQWIAFSPAGYFAYIATMGAVLTAGAIGAFRRRRWGHALIALYLVLHAALFVNFQEINPKLINLGVTIVMLLVLVWARPARSDGAR